MVLALALVSIPQVLTGIVVDAAATRERFRVHPFPGGGTLASPWYTVTIGEGSSQQASFVWYTANSKRQPIVKGNNVPSLSSKDTSFASFDLSGPTPVTVRLLNDTGIDHAVVLPTSADIFVSHNPGRQEVTFTIDRPRQVCLIVNQNMDSPLCIFADPPEINPPTGPSENLVYFGPGVHHVPGNAINVTANQSVYLAGGAHVFGQVRAVPTPANMYCICFCLCLFLVCVSVSLCRFVFASLCLCLISWLYHTYSSEQVGVQWNGFWVGGAPCDNVRVFGRGVLDGHNVMIDYRAHAMIELPDCTSIRVEGIITIDSPQYQLNNLNPGAVVLWAKSIAWGFSTDGWSGGEQSLISDCFSKVNDDSHKLYSTGAVVQRSVVWQMENGALFSPQLVFCAFSCDNQRHMRCLNGGVGRRLPVYDELERDEQRGIRCCRRQRCHCSREAMAICC